MTKKKRPNIAELLKELASFIETLEASKNQETTDPTPYKLDEGDAFVMMSNQDYGSLFLKGDTANRFFSTLNALTKVLDEDVISRKTIDAKLKEAIFVSLDLKEQHRDVSFQERMIKAIADFKEYINPKNLNSYIVILRIAGMEQYTTPVSFGGIDFVIFDDSTLDLQKKAIRESTLSEESKITRLENIKKWTEETLDNQPVALVTVKALEVTAARSSALKKLQSVIDVLHFYTDILYRQKTTQIVIFGQESLQEAIPVLLVGKPAFLSQSQKFPTKHLNNFKFHDLLYGRGRNINPQRVSDMLNKSQRNEIEERIISAMQWAGRATVEDRNEEAFLLYAIALESLIMERGPSAELNFRLIHRIAHLLGTDFESRKNIRERTKELYKIRSKIVHTGSFEVSDSDLQYMRLFTKECIARILTGKEFETFEQDQQLIDWFDDRLLG